MKGRMRKAGFTLLEILMVIAVIAVLTLITVNVARRIENQSKQRLAEDTIAIITAALAQFADYGYQFKHTDYANLKFPPDCNNYFFSGDPSGNDIATTLAKTLGADSVAINNLAGHDNNYSGSEVLFFFLNQVPASRETLNKIDRSLITNKGSSGPDMIITIVTGTDVRTCPLFRIIDPWGTSLNYDYYDERAANIALRDFGRKTFPVITSAGPDKKFGTIDDIRSK